MASIEGLRGQPSPRPPYPAETGLWGCPTLINNVETLANVPPIVRQGVIGFADIGTESSKGTKVFALAGRIKNTGLIEVPMGITLRRSWKTSAAESPRGDDSRRCKPAVRPADVCRGIISTCRSTTIRSAKPVRSWVRAA